MPHPRSLVRLAMLIVTAVAMCSAPGTAHAKSWTVPRTSSHSLPSASADFGVKTVASDVLEDALLVGINNARAANGLRKIWNLDACTDQLAEDWGQRIARTGIFEHRDQNEVIRRCDASWAGETLVRGVGLSPEAMVQLWLDSPGHREILLSPRARRAGISIEQDAEGRVIGVVNLVRRN